MGNLDNLDNLDTEKDVEDTILPIVDQREAPKEAFSKAAKGAKKRWKTAGAQEDEDNKDIKLIKRQLWGKTRTPEAILNNYLMY